MVDSPQQAYIHDVYTSQDDREEGNDYTVNTYGHTPSGAREAIKETIRQKIADKGIREAAKSNKPTDIALVYFDGNDVSYIELYDWVTEEFSTTSN